MDKSMIGHYDKTRHMAGAGAAPYIA